MTGQMELRFERDGLLDQVNVRASVKAVLYRIARYPECWETQSTMRRACGFKTVKTIQRAIAELTRLDLITTARRWRADVGRVVNHHRVNWEELRRFVERHQSDIQPPRRKRHSVPTKETLSPDQSDTESPITKNERKLKPTTNSSELVELVFLAGVKRARAAVQAARAAGITDEQIRERYQRWRELPESSRLPGVLYNWLALRGSWESNATTVTMGGTRGCTQPTPGRGDALSRDEVKRNRIRWQIVKAGRAAGADQAEIDRRCQLAGV